MTANQAVYPVRVMCRLFEVSASGFYAWVGRPPSARRRSDEGLTSKIAVIHARSDGTYGSPRIHAELVQRQGLAVGRKRVARLMRKAQLRGVQKRGFTVTTVRDASRPVVPDLVRREFTAKAADQLWVADITYIPTQAGFLYCKRSINRNLPCV